jgi:hypothetical protein
VPNKGDVRKKADNRVMFVDGTAVNDLVGDSATDFLFRLKATTMSTVFEALF